MVPRAVRLGEIEAAVVTEGVGGAVVAGVVTWVVDAELDLSKCR